MAIFGVFTRKCNVCIPFSYVIIITPLFYNILHIVYLLHFSSNVTLEGKEKGGLKAKRSWLVRGESRRYASNFCKAAQTS